MNKAKVREYYLKGHWIGGLAYVVGGYNSSAYKHTNYWLFEVIAGIGFIIFGYYAYLLYVKDMKTNGLVTTGLFKYTRHPMYTGVAMAYFTFLNPANYTPAFWVLTAVHYAALIVGAYFQEKELLFRFGKKTKEYYKTTPRLFFMYPFRKYFRTR